MKKTLFAIEISIIVVISIIIVIPFLILFFPQFITPFNTSPSWFDQPTLSDSPDFLYATCTQEMNKASEDECLQALNDARYYLNQHDPLHGVGPEPIPDFTDIKWNLINLYLYDGETEQSTLIDPQIYNNDCFRIDWFALGYIRFETNYAQHSCWYDIGCVIMSRFNYDANHSYFYLTDFDDNKRKVNLDIRQTAIDYSPWTPSIEFIGFPSLPLGQHCL